jgi:hypothetical protein
MDKPIVPNRWFAGWRMAQRSPLEDPADVGTAFGLDLSMAEGLPVAPQAQPGASRAAGWMQPWSARGKPAL